MNAFLSFNARTALAAIYGKKFGLDTALLCAVIEHESSWDQWAIRYEPAFFSKYILPLMDKGIVQSQTEARARATSWGLMQIMGQVAREQGFTGQFLSQLCDPDYGLDQGCRKLQRCMNLHVGDVEAALLAYNGGSDPNYPAAVKSLMGKYLNVAG